MPILSDKHRDLYINTKRNATNILNRLSNMTPKVVFLLLILFVLVYACLPKEEHSFPDYFKFGVATSSYQVEGGWNADGKSESIWDYGTHTFPENTANSSNGDIACDSYNKIDEDVSNLKKLKVDFYRFSISWPRIMPSGFTNIINEKGIDYYNRLIDSLLKNNIQPMITLFHWDLPQSLQNLGGWANPLMADYFENYAEVCFKNFGDRVKLWITMNEPTTACYWGYALAGMAPYYASDGVGNYMCQHNMIRAHTKAYRMYEKLFKDTQKGTIGITLDGTWYEPASNKIEDIEATEAIIQTNLGSFLHPFLSETGNYPAITREKIDAMSKKQGFTTTRLPEFSPEEIQDMKGALDFIGLNYYSTYYVTNKCKFSKEPSLMNDLCVTLSQNEEWPNSARDFFKIVPWGMRKSLNWINNQYKTVPIIVTENGYASFQNEGLDDEERIVFTNEHLKEVLLALHEDGCNITGYTHWSLMDNFEWMDGYTMRFGLYHVDFNDVDRKRTPKQSAFIYQHIIVHRKIDEKLRLDNFLYK